MAREATPLVVPDLSAFARRLRLALDARDAAAPRVPGHVELQNLVARAAGYRNLQALKAAPPGPRAAPAGPDADDAPGTTAAPVTAAVAAPAAPALTDHARRTLQQFDEEGRLVRWPTKFTVQRMAMWILWTRFEGKRVYTEREVNAILRQANAFGDHVTLRRELVNHRLLTRKSDCSEYRKLPARPDDEVRALLGAWRARSRSALAVQPARDGRATGREAGA